MVAITGMSAAEAAHRGGVGAALVELAIGLAAGAILGRWAVPWNALANASSSRGMFEPAGW